MNQILAQYNFKTTDESITEYLKGKKNKSEAIKEALLFIQRHELNSEPEEKKELENVMIKI